MINIQKMMQQAQQVQLKLAELQEKFKDMDIEGEAGGGIVRVTLSCAGVLKSVQIDPTILSADGKEMIEDLIVAAHNMATEAKDERVKYETQQMMEQMGLPKDGSLPFN
jgi:nucleoid-associated protein EbfC